MVQWLLGKRLARVSTVVNTVFTVNVHRPDAGIRIWILHFWRPKCDGRHDTPNRIKRVQCPYPLDREPESQVSTLAVNTKISCANDGLKIF